MSQIFKSRQTILNEGILSNILKEKVEKGEKDQADMPISTMLEPNYF